MPCRTQTAWRKLKRMATEQRPSCSKAIEEDGHRTKPAQQFGNCYKKIAGFSCKRTLNRDLPDQLEAHAHPLLKDAGWSIKPRLRNDRTKMAYYFAAPQREVVVSSLSQAWKFCGQRLHTASGGSEWGKFPMEWSDAEQFCKDLVNTMDGVGKTTADGEVSLTLLRRWQLLDPFVAVVFIDKRITALQKQKILRAVDSLTSVIDSGDNRPSEDKSSPLRPCSGYSQVATDSCHGHRDVQNCHHLSSRQGNHVKAEHCSTHNMDPEASSQTENHVQSNDEPEQTYFGANLGNNLVKRVRKKSKWLSDFESTGLNGLYAQSFTDPTIGSNEHRSCSDGSTSKKHMKAKKESAKMSGEKRDLSLRLACERINDTRGEGRTEGPVEPKGCSETRSPVAESSANKIVIAENKKSRTLRKSSVRGLSKGLVDASNDSNVLAEVYHKRNATRVECSTSLEAQINMETTIERKQTWGYHAKKRPFEMDFDDDDLLITAIVKKRDISSCHKSASMSGSSTAKLRKCKESSKKGSRLLIQTAREGGMNVLNGSGRQIILARKTVLCWLIATGFLTLKDVVQCRNPKNSEVVKDGWITWDGILCSCCIKTLSMSDFKAHADNSLPKSSLNLCLQSGKSFTLCQLEA